jgi:GNAT superfamily N-acetyltransferase
MPQPASRVAALTVKPLTAETWDAYAELVARHNGVFGGCWCTWFHRPIEGLGESYERNCEIKHRLVREGHSHAAVVFDGEEAVGWCQFGKPEELPNIYHRKEWEATTVRAPDYRLTCIFVDKRYRRSGVSAVAIQGALELIAEAGGGVVEAYPHDNGGKRVAVLYNGTRALFERLGFSFDRPKGMKNTVMVKVVSPAGRNGS